MNEPQQPLEVRTLSRSLTNAISVLALLIPISACMAGLAFAQWPVTGSIWFGGAFVSQFALIALYRQIIHHNTELADEHNRQVQARPFSSHEP